MISGGETGKLPSDFFEESSLEGGKIENPLIQTIVCMVIPFPIANSLKRDESNLLWIRL